MATDDEIDFDAAVDQLLAEHRAAVGVGPDGRRAAADTGRAPPGGEPAAAGGRR